MDSFLCRLCRASIASGSDVCLFSQTVVRQNLPGRITDLLDVPIAAKDGLPQHICNKCKRKLERLEKAAEELEDFRTQASSNHTILASTRRELKRIKETSASVGVSPDTAKTCRQPEKYVLSFIDGLDASCLFVFQSHRSTAESVQNRAIHFSNVKFKVRLIGW